jgi:hypothetical protein
MKNLFNYLTICLLLITILFSSSCNKKKDTTTPSTPATAKILKEISHSTTSIDTTKYFYNSSGKPVKITSSSDTSYTTIEYSSTAVTLKFFDKNNVLTTQEIFNLNSSGLATTAVVTDFTKSSKSNILLRNRIFSKGNNSTSYNFSYTYDSNGYLTHEIKSFPGATITDNYTISNGNTISYTEVQVAGSTTNNSSGNYTFLTDKTNTIGMQNCGIAFLGKDNKNLESVLVRTYSSGSNTTNYNYEYDSKNRVTKMTETPSVNSTYTEYFYTD